MALNENMEMSEKARILLKCGKRRFLVQYGRCGQSNLHCVCLSHDLHSPTVTSQMPTCFARRSAFILRAAGLHAAVSQ